MSAARVQVLGLPMTSLGASGTAVLDSLLLLSHSVLLRPTCCWPSLGAALDVSSAPVKPSMLVTSMKAVLGAD